MRDGMRGIRRFWSLACAFAMATSLTGCASSSNYATEAQDSAGSYAATAPEGAEWADVEEAEKVDESDEGSVIIKDGSVVLRTRNYDDALDAVRKAIAEANGTQVSSSESGGYGRSITIEARVDPEKIEETVEKLRGIENCTVLSANLNSSDVTRTFNETERRIEILEEQYEHYKTMLDAATTTEDMLLISDRMYDVMAEIKVLTDERDDMSHNAAHSLLRVTIEEELTGGSSGETRSNIYADAWEDSWGFFGQALQSLALLAIFLIPFALLAAIIVAVVRLILKRRRKARASKTADANANANGETQDVAEAMDAAATPEDADDGRPPRPPLP